MIRLDSRARIDLSLNGPLGASLRMYPSERAEAKRLRSRTVRQRMREAGMTEIVLVLPKHCVAQLDVQKTCRGFRNRGQVIEELLMRRSADQNRV